MHALQTPDEALPWLRAHVRGSLHGDSRLVTPGDGFLAWPGARTDGRAHVAEAMARGASACLVEQEGLAAFGFAAGHSQRMASLPGLQAAAGPLAAQWFGQPGAQLDMLAVTGTNGKTSTAWWLAEALNACAGPAQPRCALVGTLGMGVPPALEPAGMTTPDPVRLQCALHQFVRQGLSACAIEASSIGLDQGRLAGTPIRVAIFTNFTQDHLDYHGSMAAYWRAKRALFDWPGLQAAVVNVDDPAGARLHAELVDRGAGRALDLWSVSIRGPARLAARDIVPGAQGLCFTVVEGERQQRLPTRLVGHYNVANLLGVLATLRSLGLPLQDAVQAGARLQPVPGRMQQLALAGQPLVVVDYAHTPDALAQALQALRPLASGRAGRLWCVFGCGGGRDAGKRPLMGALAQQLADQVLLTSDNPRGEDPAAILRQILQGIHADAKVCTEPDRAVAIAQAVARAAPADVLLIAGKGHEEYQEAAGVRLPFSDIAHAHSALQDRAGCVAGPRNPGAMMTLQQAFALLQPRLPAARLVGDGATPLLRVHSDTRTLQAGDLFVAIKGQRFDANAFLDRARAGGCAAALAQGGLAAAGLPGIEVPDSLQALGALAAGWRAQFSLPLIAVAGSNGKTTVTQMVAAILRAEHGDAAWATQGNFNNAVGLPLTLLCLRATHAAAVVELGMNHPGEIAALARIAQPTVALVNNAQREHLEFMHTVAAVARENGAVLASLPADGVAVFPADDDYQALWRQLATGRACLDFGAGGAVDCRSAWWQDGAWALTLSTPQGSVATQLHIAGRHNIRNALAAAACALAAGASLAALARGLDGFRPLPGRSRSFGIDCAGRQVTVVDDSYNANPDSLHAAIGMLAELPGPQLLVLGDMGEVGVQAAQLHAQAGAQAKAAGIARLFALGEQSAHAAAAFGDAQHFTSMQALCAAVRQALPQVGSVLVKGSRFMQMEQVVAAIGAAALQADAAALPVDAAAPRVGGGACC